MNKIKKGDFFDLAKKAMTSPQEMLVKSKSKGKIFSLGIPKEEIHQERRVPLSPLAVKMLAYNDVEILLESEAGKFASFSDKDYSDAGAKIVYNKKEVYQTDILLKIAFPGISEIELMKSGQLLISAMDIPHLEVENLKALIDKRVSALSYEFMKDESGIQPVVQSMSEIAGNASVFIASDYLAGEKGCGKLFGGITGVPSVKVIILGAGTVGQYAAKAAIALGAEVKVFDYSLHKLRRLTNISNQPIYNAIIQPVLLAEELKTAEVVIGALRPENGRTPCVVTEDMVMSMKENAVLIDISIDHGGCFETSKVTSLDKPSFKKHGIIHYCVPNIPSIIPATASVALSNILGPFLTEMSEAGSLESYLWEKPFIRNGIYMYKGILTNSFLGSKFNLNNKSLDLLLTSRL